MVREKVSDIWQKIFQKYDQNLLFLNLGYFLDILLENLKYSNYNLGLSTAHFFLLLFANTETLQKTLSQDESLNCNFLNKLPTVIEYFGSKMSMKYNCKDGVVDLDIEEAINLDEEVNFTLRKCSFRVIDHLAVKFPKESLSVLMLRIQNSLNSSDPVEK